MTEICGIGTLQLSNHKNGSCGTVAENIQIKIVNPENGKILGPNNSGELWIKTETLTNGYYRNPEATKSTIDEEGKQSFFLLCVRMLIILIILK